MKFGVADYGMNVWDGGNSDFETRLEELRSIGYDGTERLECIDAADAMYKAAAYRRLGMDFATCQSVNPETTLRFGAALGVKYIWLTPGNGSMQRTTDMETFLRRANRFAAVSARFGVEAALHNHLGTRIENQEELDRFMLECPGASLLLDIGHLHGAGGDVIGTIDRYFDRIAAVHFKDVFIKDESIGIDHWPSRLRFCELGGGNCGVPWEEAAKLLKKRGYDKWVLIEHDTHLRDPLEDLSVSLDALKKIFC